MSAEEALAAAARDIATGPWMDTDGETTDEWCHWCDEFPAYRANGKTVERHRDDCALVALRAALEAYDRAAQEVTG